MGIFIDQTGYLPVSRKVATTTFPCNFQLIDSTTQHAVYDGVSTDSGMDESAGEQVYQLDFSKVNAPGRYYVLAGNGERSHTFVIGEHVYEQLHLDLMKCFYFQRCGCALTSEYAGEYTHAACHTEDAVFLEDYMNQTPDPPHFDMTGG